jgi:hypothetical protein
MAAFFSLISGIGWKNGFVKVPLELYLQFPQPSHNHAKGHAMEITHGPALNAFQMLNEIFHRFKSPSRSHVPDNFINKNGGNPPGEKSWHRENLEI